MTRRLVLLGEALVTGAAAAAAVAAVVDRRPGGPLLVGLAVLVALGGAPLRLAVSAGADPTGDDDTGDADDTLDTDDTGDPADHVTFLVRAGGEPAEVLAATVALASGAGPTVLVVPDDREVDVDGLGVVVHRGGAEEALRSAADSITTSATIVLSGRAVPDAAACRRAAGRLGDDVGWVCGRAGTLNADSYVDERAGRSSAALRHRARHLGLDLWEPDATLVRTDLLRTADMAAGRPWGRWLRTLRAAEPGLRGSTTDAVLARRLAPSAERAYWPDTTARQRAAAADAADAADLSRGRARRAAHALLVESLLAWRVAGAALLVLPMAADRSTDWAFTPFAVVTAMSAVGLVRHVVTGWVLGIPVAPVADAVAVAHRAPGSFTALGPAMTGRVRRSPVVLPTRLLTWVALAITAASGARLVDRVEDGPSSTRAIIVTLASLAVVWAFAVRAVLRRNYARTTFRVPVAVNVSVDGHPATAIDASPGGLSVSLAPDAAVRADDHVEVSIPTPDGEVLRLDAVVVGVRDRAGSRTAGVRLTLDGADRARWMRTVMVAASAVAETHRRRGRGERPLHATSPSDGGDAMDRGGWGRWTDRLAVAVGAALSIGVLAVLALVLAGNDTLVIRSGSMVPTYAVGDVVISEPVAATSVRVGDVVTIRHSSGGAGSEDSLTHRVRAIGRSADGVVLTTRGDANRTAETWVVGDGQVVGRARWHLPWIGRPALALRDGSFGLLVTLGGGLLLVTSLVRSVRPARRAVAAPTAPGPQC